VIVTEPLPMPTPPFQLCAGFPTSSSALVALRGPRD
jgi:hypothetical protein